jgi:hypothetical protein
MPRSLSTPAKTENSTSQWVGVLERVVALAALLFLICAYAASASELAAPKEIRVANDPHLTTLVRGILQHEIRAEADDKSLWCYRKLIEKDGKRQLFAACQTQLGEIDRLMAEDGKPLSQKERQQENQRIEKLLGNTDQLKKQRQQQAEDDKQATNLLRMIPEAFLFQEQKNDGDRIELKFSPNPQFHPSGYSEMVFHHMDGTLTLDLKRQRLIEISGRLDSEVKFAGGLFGHLDKGGTFYVKQQEVTPGHWVMISMDVKMNGKALLFKTIGVRNTELDTDFHSVSPSSSLEQLAALTNQSLEKSPIHAQR